MVKKLFSIFMCLVFILILGGCSAKPGVAFDGKSIWTDPEYSNPAIEEIISDTVNAEKICFTYEWYDGSTKLISDKDITKDLQDWLAALKLTQSSELPIEDVMGSGAIHTHSFSVQNAAGNQLLRFYYYDISNNIRIFSSADENFLATIDNIEEISGEFLDIIESARPIEN